MPPRIAINGASFPQRITGVQRYAREVSARMLAHADVRLLLPGADEAFVAPEKAVVELLPPSAWSKRLGPWVWVNTTLRAGLAPDEILWSPTIRAPLWVRAHVPTVHDLSVLDHPEWFRKSVVAQWKVLLPSLCRQAPHVITDSMFSRDRLVQHLGMAEERISVVSCGVDLRFAGVCPDSVAELRERLGLPDRFILALGSADPRKNIGHLLNAWRSLSPRQRDNVHLVLAGGTARTFAKDPFLQDLPDDVLHLGYVADSDLPALYTAATVFAYPSRYEGFGLPPLEAMAAGTPVIALAATGAVAEVVEGAGLLIEGHSPGAFAEGLSELLNDENCVRTLVAEGRKRAAIYSWESSAEGVLAVLRKVGSAR